jgi:Na+/phosphate symporter
MKSLGELLFGLILLFLTGNLAKQQIYKPLKQETEIRAFVCAPIFRHMTHI